MAIRLTESREELEARIRAAEQVVAANRLAGDCSSSSDVVRALIDQGDAYREMRENDDAVRCYDRALTRLSHERPHGGASGAGPAGGRAAGG